MKKRFDAEGEDSRSLEKQASRDRDAGRLAAGEITGDQMKRENNFFSSLPIKRFKMTAIGGKAIK